jgi:Tfp pilus assembly protein PilO
MLGPVSLSPRNQRIVQAVLLVLILANIPLYLVFVRPAIEADAGEQAHIQQVRQQVARRAATLNALRDIERKLKDSREKYKMFEREFLFSHDQGTSELLKELDAICAEAGLLRNRVAYRLNPDPVFGMQRLGIVLPIEGTYSNIRNFLNILENTSKFVIVESMALVSEREGTGTIRLDVSLSTLFLAQP